MKKFIFSVGTIALIFIGVFFINSASADEADVSSYIKFSSGAIHYNNLGAFSVGSVLDATEDRNTIGGDINFDLDGFAQHYKLAVGYYKQNPLKIETSFEFNTTSFKDSKNVFGTFPTDIPLFTIIDGTSIFTPHLEFTGVEQNFNCTLKYDQDYYAFRINADYNLFKRDKFNLDVTSGLAYSCFYRKYKYTTSGVANMGGGAFPMTSGTSERLLDNLFGLNLGLSADAKLTKRLSISSLGSVDLFYRHSDLKAEQGINAYIISSDAMDTYTAVIKDKTSGFTPHFIANVDLKYNIYKNMYFSCFYQFDYWYNLTNVQNPQFIGGELLAVGSTHIKKQDLITQAVGGAITVEF